MPFDPLFHTTLLLPALFQMQRVGGVPRTGESLEELAREFMSGYADDLRNGRRQAIAERYDRRGAYRVGEGEKTLESWELIRAGYMTQWTPPTRFAWHDLSFEAVSDDAIIVVGLFDWGLADGRNLSFSYTGLLVRQNGGLMIRLEDESMSPRVLAALNGAAGRA